MPDLKAEKIERYLQSVLGEHVRVFRTVALRGDRTDVKGYGYGTCFRRSWTPLRSKKPGNICRMRSTAQPKRHATHLDCHEGPTRRAV